MTWSSGRGIVDGSPRLDRRSISSTDLDEALRAQEADRQLRLVARRPHRDRHVDRLLPGAGGADLHRLLAGQAVLARLDAIPAR